MKFDEEKVALVRDGKAQVKVNEDNKHAYLLNYIFPKRGKDYVSCVYYRFDDSYTSGCDYSDEPFPDLPIIEADEFYITTPKPNWVEVSDREDIKFEKRILAHDLGDKVASGRYICVMKYDEEKVQLVRDGKAQIKADKNDKCNDLLNYIFPKRGKINVYGVYYCFDYSKTLHYDYSYAPHHDLPIIEADDFYITTPEPNWVEVSNRVDSEWKKAILIHDLGDKVIHGRYLCVLKADEDKYLSDNEYNFISWNFMRPIPAPKELTHAEIEKLIGEPFIYKL